jgi:hypothetical protein
MVSIGTSGCIFTPFVKGFRSLDEGQQVEFTVQIVTRADPKASPSSRWQRIALPKRLSLNSVARNWMGGKST